MLTPFIAQVFLRINLYSAISVYAVMGLLAALTAWFLPVETLGLQLNESGHQATKGRQELVNQESNEENSQPNSLDISNNAESHM